MINSKPVKSIISILLALMLVLSLSVPVFSQEIATAQLIDIEGSVFLKKAGGQREFQAVDGMRVSQGDWIRTDEDSSVSMKHQSLVMKELISSVKPGLQKQMLLDMVERTDDIQAIMGLSKKEFEDYGKEEDARKALGYSSQIIDLIDLIESFIDSAASSEQGEEFLYELEKDKIKIKDLKIELLDIKGISQATWEEVIKNAEGKGIAKKDIIPQKKDIPKGDAPGNSGDAPGQTKDAPGQQR